MTITIPVQWLTYITTAISVASLLIGALPPPKNMKTGYAYVWQFVDWIALNFGNGKTAVKAVATGDLIPASKTKESK